MINEEVRKQLGYDLGDLYHNEDERLRMSFLKELELETILYSRHTKCLELEERVRMDLEQKN